MKTRQRKSMNVWRNCGDCGAKPGALHRPGCDVERCPRCGHQMISCPCIYEVNGMDYYTIETEHPEIFTDGPTDERYLKWEQEWGHRRMPWTGEWPGVAECREFGLWAVFGPDMVPPRRGWVAVPADTSGAREDLNSLYTSCSWNPETQRWERPS